MDERGLLVRGEIQSFWLIFCRTLWVLMIGAAAMVFALVNPGPGGWLLLGGLFFGSVVEGWLYFQRRKRAWFVDLEEGFVYKDRTGRREFDDTQVVAVYLHHRRVYREGILKAINRRFQLTVDGEPRPLIFQNQIKADQRDPLQPFIDRTLENYRAMAHEALSAGSNLAGQGWSLSRQGLNFGSGQTIPLADISGVSELDNQVCIWRKGEEEASFKVAATSKHAFLLHLLVDDLLASRHDDEPVNTTGFGRLLFERGSSFLHRIAAWLVAAILTLVTLGCALADEDGVWMIAVGTGATSALVILSLILTRKSFFRCHERGVKQRTWRGERILLFEDVGAFTYQAVRHYHNGVYAGTMLSMTLEPLPDVKTPKVRYGRTVKSADESLDQMRDVVASFIASRWIDQLATGESIQWTPSLIIHPSGIEYQAVSWFGRKKKPVQYQFNEVTGYDIDEGYLHIWVQGADKSVIQESTAKRNFFPGFNLFDVLYREQFAT